MLDTQNPDIRTALHVVTHADEYSHSPAARGAAFLTLKQDRGQTVDFDRLPHVILPKTAQAPRPVEPIDSHTPHYPVKPLRARIHERAEKIGFKVPAPGGDVA